AFLGSMDWHANVDAILHFAAHTLPLIKKSAPGTRVILIGRNPPPALRALAAADPAIEVTGTVDDVRPHLARASIMILPLRVGGGTRIKVFEGMAAGLALVSSRIGVEGLPVEDGVHALLADEPAAFAAAVLSLIQDSDRRSRMARTARQWVEAGFSWDRAARQFLELCGSVL
ncbi:MAG TPA: glycosyltransferase family 4 protein, partial [Prosthecobacter sp.]|nr:glycosyltransferase family 4 protein [Prosthecobacter sp.]HRK17063.1 glycosyltransferase family 4 protein [Prosthecobacter sp.]